MPQHICQQQPADFLFFKKINNNILKNAILGIYLEGFQIAAAICDRYRRRRSSLHEEIGEDGPVGHAPNEEGIAENSEGYRARGSSPPGGHIGHSVGMRSKS